MAEKHDQPDDDEQDEERPWTEAQWAAFMREGEARAARMGEILETVIDQPDRWEIVAKEMGWELGKDLTVHELSEDDDGDIEPSEIEDDDDESTEEIDEASERFYDDDPDALHDEDLDEKEREIEAIPAYAKAVAVSEKIDKLLDPLMKKNNPGKAHDEDVAELVSDAFIQIKIVAAKISGGHAMGYEDDVLCGNIVCNTIAREAIDKCVEALDDLAKRKLLNKRSLPGVMKEIDALKKTLDDRIAEMRAKVWW